MSTAVLLAAAGSGTRLGASMPKALAPLSDGRTLLEHGLETVARLPQVAVVVVLVPPEAAARAEVTAIVEEAALRLGMTASCVPGGAERADSVAAGLAEVARLLGAADPGTPAPGTSSPATLPDDGTHLHADRHLVLVHDAARPFTPPSVFAAVVAALGSADAVIPAVPVTDTVKEVRVDADGAETVVRTPSRATLRAVQTPQGFDLDALLAAHEQVRRDPELDAAALTDDAMVMEAAGHAVRVVPGHADAFKITTPADLETAAALIARRSLS